MLLAAIYYMSVKSLKSLITVVLMYIISIQVNNFGLMSSNEMKKISMNNINSNMLENTLA